MNKFLESLQKFQVSLLKFIVTQKAAAKDPHLNADGTFIGGFDGCVEHMQQCEGHSADSAKKLCAFIGRQVGKV